MQAHDVSTPGTTHRPARILDTRTPETKCGSPPSGKARVVQIQRETETRNTKYLKFF